MQTIREQAQATVRDWCRDVLGPRLDEWFLFHLTASPELKARLNAAFREWTDTLRRIQASAVTSGGAYQFAKWEIDALRVNDEKWESAQREILGEWRDL